MLIYPNLTNKTMERKHELKLTQSIIFDVSFIKLQCFSFHLQFRYVALIVLMQIQIEIKDMIVEINRSMRLCRLNGQNMHEHFNKNNDEKGRLWVEN